MKYEIWTKAMEEISDRHIVEAAKIQKKSAAGPFGWA